MLEPNADLFSPLAVRGVTMRNRIGVSPMCQYSCVDGVVDDWHVVHLGSRAVGGAGLVIAEATSVVPEGRITPSDAGIWNDEHIEPWARATAFIDKWGAVPGIQLAHAGRKAACWKPWIGKPRGTIADADGGWEPVAPSAIRWDERFRTPRAMTGDDIRALIGSFREAAERSVAAGFRLIEIHAAHGYLLHEFHSPLTNTRDDAYGGSFESRTRVTVEVARAIRSVVPDAMPLAIRLSCTDYAEGGWTLDESIELSRLLKREGVDLVDCSSGGAVPNTTETPAPDAQIGFAERIRREAEVRTMAVGNITGAEQAAGIIADGKADVALLAREFLRDPYWPVHAAIELGRYDACPYVPGYDHWIDPAKS